MSVCLTLILVDAQICQVPSASLHLWPPQFQSVMTLQCPH